ncbi:class II fructose-bisphosphate aldolase [Streptomyces sp. NPDC059352]|uniref:class II fructose-bisphosphate aldolase n=1 Tax=Streptomyces sp. NPDC059352 TaxID=3346810 RepID=UPI0036879A89
MQQGPRTAPYRSPRSVPLAPLGLARAAAVLVAVHLDHAESAGLIRSAVGLGFTSSASRPRLHVRDGRRLQAPLRGARGRHRDITASCHRADVWVEAELGEVGGKDGAPAPGVRTDPEEARNFAVATTVDALAVAVGSSHAMTSRDAVLDSELTCDGPGRRSPGGRGKSPGHGGSAGG